MLKKISIIDSKVTSYNFFGSGIIIQSFILIRDIYWLTCYTTNYNSIKFSPFSIYNLKTDQHVCLCIENKYDLSAANVFNSNNVAVVSSRSGIYLWDLILSKIINCIRDIHAIQLEISEDDSRIILLNHQYSLVILDPFSLEKIGSLNSGYMVVMRVHTEASIILYENKAIKVFNFNNENRHEIKNPPVFTKSKKYCLALNLSIGKIYVVKAHGRNGIFRIY